MSLVLVTRRLAERKTAEYALHPSYDLAMAREVIDLAIERHSPVLRMELVEGATEIPLAELRVMAVLPAAKLQQYRKRRRREDH